MIRLFWRLGLLAAVAALFAWLADRPGLVTVRWLGREIETPLLFAVAVVLLAVAALWFVYQLLRRLFRSPRAVGDYMRFRRARKGYESLSRGIIAAGAGDGSAARRHAQIAAKTLNDEPLVKLLEAQAAQLKGDKAAVKSAFEAMLKSPDTEALGLRGLFAEARQAGDMAKAREFAERALRKNPSLAWASSAMLQAQLAARDWPAASQLLEQQRKAGLVDAETTDRKRAALHAAEALDLETTKREQALNLALKAHQLDPALVPAAAVAARIHAHQNAPRKVFKVLRRTWALMPHPDLAEAWAYARHGDGPRERLVRIRELVANHGGGLEADIALARSAIAAKEWAEARSTLKPYLENQPEARICALMADLEEGETGDKGRAREWLARAIHAPPAPLWVIDGVASPRWSAVSPVTGEVAIAVWKQPYDALARPPEPAATSAPVMDEEPEPEPEPAVLAAPTRSVEPERPRKVEPVRPPDDPGLAEDEAEKLQLR
jgi:HemY protein